jgi:hypothetical protein
MSRAGWPRAGAVLILVSLVSACVISVTPKMPPEATGGAMPTTFLANRMPTPKEKFAIHSVENSYFGVSDVRRSLPLGLVLGPLGVAANQAHVRGESERKSDDVKSLFPLDAAALLRAEAPDLRPADGAGSDGPRLEAVPSAALLFVDDDSFELTCFVNVVMLEGAKETWRARYGVNAEGTFNVKSSGLLATMTAELSACLKRAYGLYRTHFAGALKPYREYAIETKDSTRYMPVYESGLPSRVIAYDGFGVIELRRSGVRKLTPR